jgi:hypothetical protein
MDVIAWMRSRLRSGLEQNWPSRGNFRRIAMMGVCGFPVGMSTGSAQRGRVERTVGVGNVGRQVRGVREGKRSRS